MADPGLPLARKQNHLRPARVHLLSQGTDGVPDRNTVVFDVLQERAIVQPTPDGEAIWRPPSRAIAAGRKRSHSTATPRSDLGWRRSPPNI